MKRMDEDKFVKMLENAGRKDGQINALVIHRDKRTNLDNGEYTICDECPCLNNDNEEGGSCNLGYSSDIFWLKEDKLKDVSSNCLMESINYIEEEIINGVMQRTKKTFTQKAVEIVGV